MKKRPAFGIEALIGAEGRVASKLGPHADAQYLVKVRGELWKANSGDDLKPDDRVEISSVDGLTLLVGKRGS
jgi:membrane protein implicated in regulation of membrane protease activity